MLSLIVASLIVASQGFSPDCNCAKPSVCNGNGVVTAYAGTFGDIPGSTAKTLDALFEGV